ncbi:hypothetical protein PN471_02275 [Aphanizomenon sp. CS-733/32]|nr:hypothetical protein [Aphanizomenon sp. CS-733/32]MDB9307495.1 hypothetical protein [Aphanizomenon sp. CS-733/32]MDM3858986.1 hypothetical protein [Aphanizomenon gracile PMC644.10]
MKSKHYEVNINFQITTYDPKVATILIDDNANGMGWFIDPTPNAIV